MSITKANIQLRAVKYAIESNNEKINKALAHMATDPTYAMEWYADELAIGTVCKNLQKVLDRMTAEGKTEEQIVGAIADEALRTVLRPTLFNSTSMGTNLSNLAKHQFWLKLLDSMGITPYAIAAAMDLDLTP